MRKIVAGLFMSLDGVVESPEQWQFPYFNDEMGQALGSSMAASDTLLLGRRTYQEFAAVWPGRGSDDPVGAYMNNTPKLVASTTLDSTNWHNSTLLDGDLVQQIGKLKQQPGKNIAVTGSITLVRSLLHNGLLDELGADGLPPVSKKHSGTGERMIIKPHPKDDESRTFGVRSAWLEEVAEQLLFSTEVGTPVSRTPSEPECGCRLSKRRASTSAFGYMIFATRTRRGFSLAARISRA